MGRVLIDREELEAQRDELVGQLRDAREQAREALREVERLENMIGDLDVEIQFSGSAPETTTEIPHAA